MTGTNFNLYLVNMNVYYKIWRNSIVLYILSRNEILTSINGHNCVMNLQNMTDNNPNIDLVYINAYSKFGQILSICSKDIEWKRNSDINQGSQLCYKWAKNYS